MAAESQALAAAFAHACATTEDAASRATLEAARLHPAALDLARAVLQTSAPDATAVQAVLLLRDVALRTWSHRSPGERAALRSWVLETAAARAAAAAAAPGSSTLVLRNLLVLAALLFKRGWVEEGEAERAGLLGVLGSLLAPGALQGHALMGAHLALALITEFDASLRSRSTAIGASDESHRAAAAAFQAHGLREAFTLCAQALLAHLAATTPTSSASGRFPFGGLAAAASHPSSGGGGDGGGNGGGGSGGFASSTGLDRPLLAALLAALSEGLGWDFTGKGAGGASSVAAAGGGGRGGAGGRLRPICGSPGKAWRDVLADPAISIVRALGGLYGSVRPFLMSAEDVAAPARGLLCSLCGLRPDMFATPEGYGAHVRELSGVLLSWLADPLTARSAAMAAAAPSPLRISEEDAYEAGLAEAAEAAEGLNSLVWTAGVARFAGALDAGAALGTLTRYALGLLDSVEGVASAVHSAADAAVAVHPQSNQHQHQLQQRSAQAAASASSGAAAALASTHAALQSFVETRYAATCVCVDAFLELWASLLFALGEAERAAASATTALLSGSRSSGGGSGSSLIEDPAVRALAATAGEGAGVLYAALVSSRVAFATALVRVGIDDDDPVEDGSVFELHMVRRREGGVRNNA